MNLTRRNFLRLGGLTAVAAGTAGCSAVGRELVQGELPEELWVPTAVPGTPPLTQAAPDLPTLAVNPVRRLLNRAGYGPTPGEVARAEQLGLAAYLEEQLNPESIDDLAGDLIARHQSLYQMDASILVEQEPQGSTGGAAGARRVPGRRDQSGIAFSRYIAASRPVGRPKAPSHCEKIVSISPPT